MAPEEIGYTALDPYVMMDLTLMGGVIRQHPIVSGADKLYTIAKQQDGRNIYQRLWQKERKDASK